MGYKEKRIRKTGATKVGRRGGVGRGEGGVKEEYEKDDD
jgi:hypothetical protein